MFLFLITKSWIRIFELKLQYTTNNISSFNFQHFTGCYRLGDFFGALKKDFKKAGVAYRLSCEEYNHGKGCQKLGALHMYGQGN